MLTEKFVVDDSSHSRYPYTLNSMSGRTLPDIIDQIVIINHITEPVDSADVQFQIRSKLLLTHLLPGPMTTLILSV